MFPAENIPPHMKRWFQQLASMRLRLHISHLWRGLVVALMLLTYVAGMWAGIVSPSVVYAAVRHQQTMVMQSKPKPPRHGTRTYTSTISPCPSLSGTPTVSGSVDGLGTLGYYTFVKQNLDDRLLIETNVTNGNLVAQYTALQIHGTGIDLDIAFTYNSQSTASGVLGSNWNLSVGNGVSLTFNNGNATLHGSRLLGPLHQGQQQL